LQEVDLFQELLLVVLQLPHGLAWLGRAGGCAWGYSNTIVGRFSLAVFARGRLCNKYVWCLVMTMIVSLCKCMCGVCCIYAYRVNVREEWCGHGFTSSPPPTWPIRVSFRWRREGQNDSLCPHGPRTTKCIQN
jgi:hypothetical protein